MKRILSLLVIAIVAIASLSATVVVVDGVHVRLRTGPGTNYPILTKNGQPFYPAKGSSLTYVETVGNFYRVNIQGYTAYISRDFCHLKNTGSTTSTAARPVSSGTTYVVVDGVHVRLRLGASTSAPILTNASGSPVYPPKGARLTYLGTSGNFYQVNYNGYSAYISRDFCHLKKQ